MRVPESLAGLLDQGIIDEVVRPLMSGKEAHVYLVIAGGQPRVAKIYKDSQHRSFKQRAEYTEGRRVRSSRDQRAMEKRTRYGRKQDEAAWKSAEVDIIYRLRHAGVRVPEPFNFVDGVLLMELVRDADGLPAPRLAEVDLDRDEARAIFDTLLQEVVKMLCAGVVHGDLSEYNVLLDAKGPVIIDFPQSVDAASNQNAKKLLLRDVDNLTRFLVRLDHRARPAPYGHEIWAAYERNRLTPDMTLTGRRQRSTVATDTSSLLDEIEAAERDEAQRRRSLGLPPRRREVNMQPAGRNDGRGDGRRPPRPNERPPSERGPRADARGPVDRRGPPRGDQGPRDARGPVDRRGPPRGDPAAGVAAQPDGAPARRRRRRRKKPDGNGAAPNVGSHATRPVERGRSAEVGGAADRDRPRDALERTDRREPSGPRPPKIAEARGALNASGSPPREPASGSHGDANGPTGAAPKRRRRRRRRGSGAGARPPAGHGEG